MEKPVEVVIDSIAAGGDGVGRVDGLVAFVPRSAPGDRLLVRLAKASGGRFARGRIVGMLAAGPGRVPPSCQHYDDDQCGGCQLQHMRLDAQREAKRQIVSDALSRIGRTVVPVPPVTPSPRDWGYRRKLTLAVRQQGTHRVIGLRQHEHPDHVFELAECRITGDAVVAAWREVQAARDLLPDGRTLSAWIRDEGGELVFQLNGGHAWPQAVAFGHYCRSLHVVRWQPHGRSVTVLFDRRPARRAIGSFQQVNAEVAGLMREAVRDRVLAHRPLCAVDAYAGSGETAVALQDANVRVTAIELDEEAVAAASTRLREPSRVVAGRVEDVLPGVLPVDVVVLNPPRSGVDERVTDTLQGAAAHMRAVVYVSCNPATLARDVARLSAYRIRWLQPFDMFPHTAHVETICELVPRAS